MKNGTFDNIFPNQIGYIYSSHPARLGYTIEGPMDLREVLELYVIPNIWHRPADKLTPHAWSLRHILET